MALITLPDSALTALPSRAAAAPVWHRRRLVALSGLIGAVFGLWGFAIGLRPLHDNSFLTQLATGHLILSHGIPRSDPYSFTAHGHPWTVESWLADALMAVISDTFGPHAIQIFHALLTAGLALLVWRLSRPAGSPIPRVLAVVAPVIGGGTFWGERPLLVGLVLLAFLVLTVETERFSWWVVIPVMWLWVNVHGSFVLAGLYVGLRLIGRRLDGGHLGRLRGILGAVVAGTAMGALNPLGVRLLTFPLKLLGEHQNFAGIVEWQRPSLTAFYTVAFLAEATVALSGAVKGRRIEDGLPVVVFVAMGCLSQRNIAPAAIVMVPVAARALRNIGHIRGDSRPRLGGAILAAVVGIGVVLTGQTVSRPAYNLKAYPVAELSWAENHGLLQARLATPDFVGNLLELEHGAGRYAFIDDRVDMYPLALVKDYSHLMAGRQSAQVVLDKYHIGAVLWQSKSPLARRLEGDSRWRIVLKDREWLLAVREAPAAALPTSRAS